MGEVVKDILTVDSDNKEVEKIDSSESGKTMLNCFEIDTRLRSNLD